MLKHWKAGYPFLQYTTTEEERLIRDTRVQFDLSEVEKKHITMALMLMMRMY